eukprot:141147_1
MAELIELREGNFRVKVIDTERKSLLPFVYHESDTYVIAEPGREFEVEVGVTNRFLGANTKFFCSMNIDGKGVGYAGRIDCSGTKHNSSSWETFHDFRFKSGDYRHLKFDLIRNSNDEPTPKKRKIDDLGVIKILFCQALVPTASCPPGCSGEDVYTAKRESQSDNSELGTIEHSPDTKKFWKDPSLSVAPGKPCKVLFQCTHQSWKRGMVHKTFTVYYDTADRLRLRGILNPIGNPAHRKHFPENPLNDSFDLGGPSSSVPSSSAANISVSSAPSQAGSGSSPSVARQTWNCGACSEANGPRATECMFCGVSKGQSSSSSALSVKRDRARVKRRKRN